MPLMLSFQCFKKNRTTLTQKQEKYSRLLLIKITVQYLLIVKTLINAANLLNIKLRKLFLLATVILK